MVDSKPISPQEYFEISRRFYYGGFLFLPLLWILNFVWLFYPSRQSDALPMTQVYVNRSLVGAVVFLFFLVVWIIIYQQQRVEWGETGDRLSLIIPLGSY
eukprot:Sdes_comp17254_c0_seq1m6443